MGDMSSIASQTIQAFSFANDVLKTIKPTANLVQSTLGFFDDDDNDRQNQALAQLKKEQRLEEKRAAERAALQRSEIIAKAETAERKRLSALKRAVARQRANFGSQGVGSTGSSAQAVLLGLFEESDDERQDRERLDQFRSQAINQDLAHIKRVNTLQRTQLQEQNKLNRTRSDIGLVSDIFGIFG